MAIKNSSIHVLRDKSGKVLVPLTTANAVLLSNGRSTESEVSLLRQDVDFVKTKNDGYDKKLDDIKKIISSSIQSGGAASNRAADILIDDAGRYFQGLTVESALQETASQIKTLNRFMSSTDVQYRQILSELSTIKEMLAGGIVAPPGGDDKPTPDTPLEGIILSSSTLSIPEEGFEVLTAIPVPENAKLPTLIWSSSDERVATVNQTGFVTAVGVGDCIITVTSSTQPNLKATCEIEVTSEVAATDYTGLIINQIYGGGPKCDNSQSISHSFIELYNKTSKAFNLAGLSVQYSAGGKEWQKLDLRGTIPAKHSFLIRAGIHADETSTATNVFITEYDQAWDDVRFNNKGMKVALLSTQLLLNVENPFNTDGRGTKVEGYIDMIGVAGNDEGSSIDGCENRFPATQSKQKSIRRIDFRDTNDNLNDTETVDFRYVYDSYNKVPRHLAHGAWDTSEELPMPEMEIAPYDPLKPNYVINAFGRDPKTERIISWNTGTQATVGQVILTNLETNHQITVRSTVKTFVNELGSMIRHKVSLTGLTPNTSYQYVVRVGVNESETYTFKTAPEDRVSPFTFLHISDTQPINVAQCQATRDLLDVCPKTDFILHTGDIVNSIADMGAGEQMWRNFLHAISPYTPNNAFMTTPGNNDLDTGGASYNDYLAHFGAVSNDKTHYAFTYQNVFFVTFDMELYNQETSQWLRETLSSEEARVAKWRIVGVHRTRYMNELDDDPSILEMTSILEEYEVDLVLMGHKHMFMYSKPIYQGEVNNERGIRYLMCNPSGAVQSGNKKQQWWYEKFSQPMKPTVNHITIENGLITVQASCLIEGKLVLLDEFTLAKANELVEATSITLPQAIEVGTNRTKSITATVYPTVVTDKEVDFTVSDTSYATVRTLGEGKCELFGVKPGTVTLTATYRSNPTLTATSTITIEDTGEVVKPLHEYLIVNQAYGGNKTDSPTTMVSHTFIEIYNTHPTETISLEGKSIQAAGAGIDWFKFDLYGEIPPKHSFLLRGIQHNTIEGSNLKIQNYDAQMPSLQLGKGLKAVLMNNTNLLTVPNPFDIDGNGTKAEGYIDMIGVAGNDPGKTIDGYETAYGSDDSGNSKQRSVRRINFKDTDNNLEDCEICNWDEEFNLHVNKQPRYLNYGPWDENDVFKG